MGGAFLIIYGPSCGALLLVIFASAGAKKQLSVIVCWVVAVALHFLSVLFLATLLGMGEAWSGEGESHDYPRNFCIIGLIVLALPPVTRLLRDLSGSRRTQSAPTPPPPSDDM